MARPSDAFHTRCPYCQSVFKVRTEHLAIADGRVRCGNCFGVFLATEHLAQVAPTRVEPPLPTPPAAESPGMTEPIFNELGEDFELEDTTPPPASPSRPDETPLAAAVAAPAPSAQPAPADEVSWAHDPASYALPARDLSRASTLDDDDDFDTRFTTRPWYLEPDERRFDDDTGLDEDHESRTAPAAETGSGAEPELPDFDPDDPDFDIDDALLDDSVLGPVHSDTGHDWADDDVDADEDEYFETTGFQDEEPDAEDVEPPEADEAAEFESDWDGDTPWEDDADGEDALEQDADSDDEAGADEEPTDEFTATDQDSDDDEPWTARAGTLAKEELEEVLEAPPESPLRLFFWGLGSLALLVILASQLTWNYRERLAQNPRWRPWVEEFCALAHCELAPLRAVDLIELRDRAMVPNGSASGAYDVHLILVNRASFAQPYPDIELTFTDLDGKRIAVRRFKPEEYLSPETLGQKMPAGVPVHVRFSIVASAPGATGFEFRFH